MVRCKCDCGCETVAYLTNVRTGHTKSCGCGYTQPPLQTSHGLSKTPEYKSWAQMKYRCNPDSDDESNWRYRAAKITVCERWMNSFEAFLKDMGNKPSPEHSIDRIEPSGNYEPGNCKWSTPTEQNNNTIVHANKRDNAVELQRIVDESNKL